MLERLTQLVGRPLQRVGLSATVGNPAELLRWLQGSGAGDRPAASSPPRPAGAPPLPPPGDIELDYVGSLANAATVIAALHRGREAARLLRSRQTGRGARRGCCGSQASPRSCPTPRCPPTNAAAPRQAFAEARDCVIVSTSTLELGIDVGDLDRVIQIDAPGTVASFLQRLGRTGRRAGTTRNCLFLAVDERSLLQAAALLLLWGTRLGRAGGRAAGTPAHRRPADPRPLPAAAPGR